MRFVPRYPCEHGKVMGVHDKLALFEKRKRVVGKPVFDELEGNYSTRGTEEGNTCNLICVYREVGSSCPEWD
jgi:hypothetical protein